jgi:hypothetical protein
MEIFKKKKSSNKRSSSMFRPMGELYIQKQQKEALKNDNIA